MNHIDYLNSCSSHVTDLKSDLLCSETKARLRLPGPEEQKPTIEQRDLLYFMFFIFIFSVHSMQTGHTDFKSTQKATIHDL